MLAKYQKYSEYANSNVKWLGSIPSHWSIFSGKRLFRNVRRQALASDEQLAASQKYGVVPQSMMMELNDSKVMLALKGTESFRHVDKNNFVISLRSFEGGIEHSDYEGCVSPAYTVLEPAKRIFAKYYKYLLKCGPYISALQSATDSLRDGKSITFEQFSAITLAYPEYDEQIQIANFLDHETAKIDTLIDKQQQLIKLLKEKRQAVISHAVTKGLDSVAPMKDSGVEWLGEVPEHWKVKQLRHLTFSLGGGTPSKDNPDYWDGDIPWISPKDMKRNYLDNAQDKITEQAIINSSAKLIPENSVLLVVRGMILAHSVPVAMTLRPVTINQDMKAFIADKGLLPEFLLFALQGAKSVLLDMMDQSAHGTKVLSTELLNRLSLGVPPVEEQESILSELKMRLEVIDATSKRAEEFVVLSNERRTALISAAVTGKIDVRNWQPAE
jgi:type I restriction enzyme S subunit